MRLVTTAYRAHNPRWSFKPESGDGAAKAGGRFNPVGLPALYTSLRLQTAWLEAQQGFAFKAQPMMLCAYDVDCDDVLDLTNTETLKQYGITPADIACRWKDLATRGDTPPSWHVARRLIALGVAGIITPSFATGGGTQDVNVVFGTGRLIHRIGSVSWMMHSACRRMLGRGFDRPMQTVRRHRDRIENPACRRRLRVPADDKSTVHSLR